MESVDCEKIQATGAKPISKIELKQTAAKSAQSELGWCDPHLRPARLRADNCSINRNPDDRENEQPARQNWRLLLMQLVNNASRMFQQVFEDVDWVFCVRHWLKDEIVGEQWWLF